MPETIQVKVDGKAVAAPTGCTIAAAIFIAGEAGFRTSVRREPRGPLCGMGICFECRVTVDGEPHVRSCQTYCRAGMEIETGR